MWIADGIIAPAHLIAGRHCSGGIDYDAAGIGWTHVVMHLLDDAATNCMCLRALAVLSLHDVRLC
jgi:hypothetical protein